MPRNIHKCDDCIKQLYSAFPKLCHKKCDCKQSYIYTGSILNNAFNVTHFNYSHLYQVCNIFKFRMSFYEEEYNQFKATIVSTQGSPEEYYEKIEVKKGKNTSNTKLNDLVRRNLDNSVNRKPY